jgi:hypothetical protein
MSCPAGWRSWLGDVSGGEALAGTRGGSRRWGAPPTATRARHQRSTAHAARRRPNASSSVSETSTRRCSSNGSCTTLSRTASVEIEVINTRPRQAAHRDPEPLEPFRCPGADRLVTARRAWPVHLPPGGPRPRWRRHRPPARRWRSRGDRHPAAVPRSGSREHSATPSMGTKR